MPRKYRTHTKSLQIVPEDEGIVLDGAGSDEPTASEGKAVSKAEAIRRALAQGIESPEKATDFIKTQFGLEISRQHFSAAKSQIKSKAEAEMSGTKVEPAKRGRKPKGAGPLEGYLAPPSKPHAIDGEADLLVAMEAMKPLVASLGVDTVKRIAELLG